MTRSTESEGPVEGRRIWDRLTLGMCVALIASGVLLRGQSLGFPPGLTWDEHHFVKNAFNYLSGQPDWNDHPPLGKLLMAASLELLGHDALAFRLPTLAFGCLSVVLAGLLAKALFPLPRVGLLAAAFVAADGFLIAYSRTALLDGMLTSCVLLTTWLAVRARGAAGMVAASLAAGLAVSIKTSGVLAVLPIAYVCVRARKPLWLLTLVAMPIVFYLQWAYGLHLTGKPYAPSDVYEVQAALTRHHAALTEMKHPLTSRWFTWLVPIRTLPLRFDRTAAGMRVMNSLGHLLLWWATSLAVLGLSARILVRGLGQELAGERPTARDATWTRYHRPLTELVLMWWAFMSPWILTRRDSYIYHYLPAYAFGLLVLAALVARLWQLRPKVTAGALAAVLLVFVYYAPIWGQLPLTEAGLHHRLWLHSWR